LAQHDRAGTEQIIRHSGRVSFGIGAWRHRDQILARAADHDRGTAGRPRAPPH